MTRVGRGPARRYGIVYPDRPDGQVGPLRSRQAPKSLSRSAEYYEWYCWNRVRRSDFLPWYSGLFVVQGYFHFGFGWHLDPWAEVDLRWQPGVWWSDVGCPWVETYSVAHVETDWTELYLSLGDLHFKEGDYEEAARYFELAVRSDPHLAAARFALADALFALGDYAYAAFMIREGLDLEPDWIFLEIDRRDFYTNPADFEQHLAALHAHVADQPYDPAALLVLAYNEFFIGEYHLARGALERLLDLQSPDRSAGLFLKAIADRMN